MNKQQIKFIEKKLIPFVQREAGNGFAMSTWKQAFTERDVEENERLGFVEKFDGVEHRPPVCGTVACLGGSIQYLTGKHAIRSLGKTIGLSREAAHGLFYMWQDDEVNIHGYGWPRRFKTAFDKAKTPRGKASVAVRLLREVVRTKGECLHLVK